MKTIYEEYYNMKQDYTNVSNTNINSSQTEEFTFDEIDFKRFVKVSANDSFLEYIYIMACFTLSLYRINGKKDLRLGFPISEKESHLNIFEHNYHESNFMDYLNELKQTINNGIKSTQRENYANIAVILENFIKNEKVDADIIIRFHLDKENEIFCARIDYKNQKYRPETVAIFMSSFQYVFSRCLEDFTLQVSSLMKLSNLDQKFIDQYNSNAGISQGDFECIHVRFQKCAQKHSNNIALVENEKEMTYTELNQATNSLANYMITKEVKPGDVVAVLNTRKISAIISILAILKIGATYAPIDAGYPQNRINMFLDSIKIKHILTTMEHFDKINTPDDKKIILLDKEWSVITSCEKKNYEYNSLDRTAYAIFTSGSTGTPKIAGVKHLGWANLLNWFTDRYNIHSKDNIYLISSLSFDITQRSIFMALINGATLHLNSNHIYDAFQIVEYIKGNNITVLNCAPSTFYPLLECSSDNSYDELKSVRCLFLGGEAISAQRLIAWKNSCNYNAIVSNVYGVAECSDVSSYYELYDYEKYAMSSVPVGKPINNTSLFIVDENMELLPVGEIGEIGITGIGLGVGYLNDKDLTREKFTKLKNGIDIYLTGDLGRYIKTDNIEFCGRKDYQVKIRGNRIELGDIENSLRQVDIIKEAAVIVDSNQEELIAYLELRDNSQEEKQNELIALVKDSLKNKLPAYMIPDCMVICNKLPLNQNGKIDRIALRDISIEKNGKNENNNVMTGIEKDIYEIICSITAKKDLVRDMNIFDQGVHSILVMRIVGSINKKFNTKLVPLDVYLHSTISSLAELIQASTPTIFQ